MEANSPTLRSGIKLIIGFYTPWLVVISHYLLATEANYAKKSLLKDKELGL